MLRLFLSEEHFVFSTVLKEESGIVVQPFLMTEYVYRLEIQKIRFRFLYILNTCDIFIYLAYTVVITEKLRGLFCQ